MLNRISLALALLLAMPFAASAAVITANQGLNGAGTAVASGRSELTALTDNNPNSFFSLGIGGFVSYDVSPLVFQSPLTVVEVTFGTPNAGFPELAKIYFGGSVSGPGGKSDSNVLDLTGATFLGTLSNQSQALTVPASDVSITRTPGLSSSTFLINFAGLGGGPFSRFSIVDATTGSPNIKNYDGFDVSSVSFSAIPIPAPFLLLGSALLGLGALSLRRRAI